VIKLLKDHDIPNNQLIRSINQLIKLGLIASNIDKSSFPNRKILSLTGKGTKIAKRLKEIEKVLSE
jgi:predicted transcriptional regulator